MSAPLNLAIVWAQYGPYHFARMSALRKLASSAKVHAVEMANQTSVYAWSRPTGVEELITLCPDSVFENLSFWKVFLRARRTFKKLAVDVCILPGYAPRQSLAALLAAKSLRIRTVMMNESHAGTSRAQGLATVAKRRLMALFDSALVGGNPQKRYAASFGFSREKIFIGYDAVDNDYFSKRADEIRARASEIRAQFDLPENYFLSLGRFVAKKNLVTLIRAYRLFLNANPGTRTHLVIVGSGEEDAALRKLCRELRLPVHDKTNSGRPNTEPKICASENSPGVHFYGFRQIEDNPVFYSLADAFVLPSLWEEWGLVVNEAMASGLPVVVSETAGCAENLLLPGRLAAPLHWSENVRICLAQLAGRIRQNGFVFNPRSAQSLANALELLESSPELRRRMGQSSRVIIEKFSCDNFARNALAAVRAATGNPSDIRFTTDEMAIPTPPTLVPRPSACDPSNQ
ncbi:MAG TPA: glycosyltransferase family 4 protein [Verrucomicrobiae bacterium]|jgi:glycosyltransferase involved in cell wall biosynthesis|nr:glycosyltransferase family 4 protein [Verrucomicrobiae bacterium]